MVCPYTTANIPGTTCHVSEHACMGAVFASQVAAYTGKTGFVPHTPSIFATKCGLNVDDVLLCVLSCLTCREWLQIVQLYWRCTAPPLSATAPGLASRGWNPSCRPSCALPPASMNAADQASKQACKQAGRQAGRQASKQASTAFLSQGANRGRTDNGPYRQYDSNSTQIICRNMAF